MHSVISEILNETKIPETCSSNELVHQMSILRVISEIIKLRITVLVSFTTALGYILAVTNLDKAIILAPLGIFLLACGSAALNHFQERNIDGLMSRTSKRPLPAGSVKPSFVWSTAIIFFVAGGLVLYFGTNLNTLLIGLTTLIWYNAIYTPLKRKTALAVIPGSLVGALPPVAGWTAGGGYLFDFHIIYIALYFFLWQIPHFWLLLIIYGKEYKKAGLPVLNDIFGLRVLRIITSFWIVLAVLFAAGTSFVGFIMNDFIRYLLVFSGATVIVLTMLNIKKDITRKNTFRLFMAINTFTLLYILLLYIDKIISLF
ncbi:MAG: protoheme IX farnesyltransferase [Ignavibacteria bacterium]|nr:protoheme IX farnesyltransferase [Ignavibacteria bacterium]